MPYAVFRSYLSRNIEWLQWQNPVIRAWGDRLIGLGGEKKPIRILAGGTIILQTILINPFPVSCHSFLLSLPPRGAPLPLNTSAPQHPHIPVWSRPVPSGSQFSIILPWAWPRECSACSRQRLRTQQHRLRGTRIPRHGHSRRQWVEPMIQPSLLEMATSRCWRTRNLGRHTYMYNCP